MKKRIFYQDAIRVLAMLAVVFFHFQTELGMFYPDLMGAPLSGLMFRGYYLGAFGVSLFFVVSGSSLMIGRRKEPLGEYYRKRFLAIYPKFWIAWIAAWAFSILVLGAWPRFCSVEKWKLVLSVLGMDGYLLCYSPNYYIVGEWFLGCIILLYLIFPLFHWAVERKPYMTAALTTVAWLVLNAVYHGTMDVSVAFFMRAFEFMAGMYLMRYCKKIPAPAAFAGLVVAVLGMLLPIEWGRFYLIRYALIGIGVYMFLRWAFQSFVDDRPDTKIPNWILRAVSWLSGISYEVFLVHHILFSTIFGYLSGWGIGMTRPLAWGFVPVLFVASFACAWGLKKVSEGIMSIFQIRKKQEAEEKKSL